MNYFLNLIALYTAFFIGGMFGLHHFLRRKTTLGFVYIGTLGLLGFGLIFDFFAIPFYARDLG